jgi:AraC-like DNA-binding protein
LRHIEFLDNDHFERNYHRVPPPSSLSLFIDFFWETKFDHLWKEFPKGFSDAQFPNIGYTYIINLGTPFIMQVEDKKFPMRTDLFLPRYNRIECFHKPGNHLFGIKFRMSPVLFEKKIDFSEYKGAVFPLSYLIDRKIVDNVKTAQTFNERINILSNYFTGLMEKHEGSLQALYVVSQILDKVYRENQFDLSIEKEAGKHHISSRTLQRYFENCTGITGKQAIQVMRIRKAITSMIQSPDKFNYADYGYHDRSHFYKHLKAFLQEESIESPQAYQALLSKLHKKA